MTKNKSDKSDNNEISNEISNEIGKNTKKKIRNNQFLYQN